MQQNETATKVKYDKYTFTQPNIHTQNLAQPITYTFNTKCQKASPTFSEDLWQQEAAGWRQTCQAKMIGTRIENVGEVLATAATRWTQLPLNTQWSYWVLIETHRDATGSVQCTQSQQLTAPCCAATAVNQHYRVTSELPTFTERKKRWLHGNGKERNLQVSWEWV